MSTSIDDIEDIDDLCEIMMSLGLSTKGLTGVEDMKAKVNEYLKDSSRRKVGEVSTNFPCSTICVAF